jgi:cytochrome c553
MVPTWAVVLLVVLVIAGLGLGAWLAWPSPQVGTFAVDDPQLPRRAYVFCQGCHGEDGRGIAGRYPALVGSPLLTGDPAAAALLVLRGAASGRYQAAMPPMGRQLADHEIAAALTHARQSWGNQAPAVPVDLVASMRRRP